MRVFIIGLPMLLSALLGCQAVPLKLDGSVYTSGSRTANVAPNTASSALTQPIRDEVILPAGDPADSATAHASTQSELRLVGHLSTEPSNEAVLLPAPAQELSGAPQRSLTLIDLESMALAMNPAIAEAAGRVQAARGRYVQIGLPNNPIAGYSAEEMGDEGTAGKQGGFVSQEFVTADKRGLARQAVAWEVQQAEIQWAALQQRVLTDVRLGYYEVLIAQDRLALSRRLANTAGQAVEAVDALLGAKEASGAELLQAQVEADSAELLVENSESSLLGAWRRLAAVLGNPGLPLAEVSGDVAQDLPPLDFEATLARIISESPQLAARYADIQRARWSLNLAQAEAIPNVTVEGSVHYDDASDFTIAGLQFGMPLPIYNRNQGGIQQAQGELIAATRAAERTGLALQQRLATVFQQYQTSRQRVDRYSNDILPKVDQSIQLTNEGYRSGEFSYLQALTVQRTYFQSHLAYLDALEELAMAQYRIDGLLLDESLQGPRDIK